MISYISHKVLIVFPDWIHITLQIRRRTGSNHWCFAASGRGSRSAGLGNYGVLFCVSHSACNEATLLEKLGYLYIYLLGGQSLNSTFFFLITFILESRSCHSAQGARYYSIWVSFIDFNGANSGTNQLKQGNKRLAQNVYGCKVLVVNRAFRSFLACLIGCVLGLRRRPLRNLSS